MARYGGSYVAFAIASVMTLDMERFTPLSAQQRHMLKLLKSQCFGTRPNVGIFRIRGDIGEKAEGPLLVPHRDGKRPVRGQRRGNLIAVRSGSLPQIVQQAPLRGRRAGPVGQCLGVLPLHAGQLPEQRRRLRTAEAVHTRGQMIVACCGSPLLRLGQRHEFLHGGDMPGVWAERRCHHAASKSNSRILIIRRILRKSRVPAILSHLWMAA